MCGRCGPRARASVRGRSRCAPAAAGPAGVRGGQPPVPAASSRVRPQRGLELGRPWPLARDHVRRLLDLPRTSPGPSRTRPRTARRIAVALERVAVPEDVQVDRRRIGLVEALRLEPDRGLREIPRRRSRRRPRPSRETLIPAALSRPVRPGKSVGVAGGAVVEIVPQPASSVAGQRRIDGHARTRRGTGVGEHRSEASTGGPWRRRGPRAALPARLLAHVSGPGHGSSCAQRPGGAPFIEPCASDPNREGSVTARAFRCVGRLSGRASHPRKRCAHGRPQGATERSARGSRRSAAGPAISRGTGAWPPGAARACPSSPRRAAPEAAGAAAAAGVAGAGGGATGGARRGLDRRRRPSLDGAGAAGAVGVDRVPRPGAREPPSAAPGRAGPVDAPAGAADVPAASRRIADRAADDRPGAPRASSRTVVGPASPRAARRPGRRPTVARRPARAGPADTRRSAMSSGHRSSARTSSSGQSVGVAGSWPRRSWTQASAGSASSSPPVAPRIAPSSGSFAPSSRYSAAVGATRPERPAQRRGPRLGLRHAHRVGAALERRRPASRTRPARPATGRPSTGSRSGPTSATRVE